MPRARIGSKVVRATLEDKDVLGLFSEMVGGGDGGTSLAMAHPKYLRMAQHAARFVKVLALLRGAPAVGPRAQALLAERVEALEEQRAAAFAAPDLAPYLAAELPTAEDYARVPAEAAEAFRAAYTAAKDSALVATVVLTCRALVPYKKHLENPEALRPHFLLTMTATSFCPVPELAFCFRRAYVDDRLAAADKELLLVVLHKLYRIGHDMYEALTTPDMDLGEFTQTVMVSLQEVRKHIPRCDLAFDKIEKSVDLLRENFGGYYKDFVASNNPMVIMENFVLDVSQSSSASPELTRQFRQIIGHYRKLHEQAPMVPQLKSLFSRVDANFREIERRGGAADAGGGDEEGADAAPAATPGGDVARALSEIKQLSAAEE